LLADRFGQLLAYLVLGARGLHLARDDRQHAVAEIPDVLGDEHHADTPGDDGHDPGQQRTDDALADAGRHVAELAAYNQHHRAGNALAVLGEHLAGGKLRAGLARVDRVFLAGAGRHHAGDHRAIAPPEEGFHALGRRRSGVDGGKLDALSDLVAHARGPAPTGLLAPSRAHYPPT